MADETTSPQEAASPSNVIFKELIQKEGYSLEDEVVVNTDYNPRLANGVIVVILMVVGLVGNLLILYIYHFKMPKTVFSTFVTVLALLDLATILIGMPIDVVIKTVMLAPSETFTVFCKMAHFEVYCTSLASGGVLLLITVTRHTKVCRPLKPGLSRQKAYILCVLITLGAMILCTSTLFINGPEMVKVVVGRSFIPRNFTGNGTNYLTNSSDRTVADLSSEKTGEDLQEVNDMFLNSSTTTITNTRTITEVVMVYICRTNEEMKGTSPYYALQAILITAFVSILLTLLILHCRISKSVVKFEQRRSSMRRTSMQSELTHITASMFRIFATITVIFAVSYLPHLICLIVEKSLLLGKATSKAERFFLDLFYNFPYINVVANPFIYGYRSAVFRHHCLQLLCRCCRRRY